MLFGIGDKPIGSSKALLLQRKRLPLLETAENFWRSKNLLIKGADQRIKDQGMPLRRAQRLAAATSR